MNNLKFPESWEQAKTEIAVFHNLDVRIFAIYGTDEAAKLMAERYEQRIAELEAGLKTVKELAKEPSDSNSLLAGQIAKELLK